MACLLFAEEEFVCEILIPWSLIKVLEFFRHNKKFVGGKLLSIAIHDKIAMVSEKDIR